MTDRDTSAQILPLEKLVLVIVVVVVDDRPVATETDHSWSWRLCCDDLVHMRIR